MSYPKQYNKYQRPKPERTGAIRVEVRQNWFQHVEVCFDNAALHISTDGVLCILEPDGSIRATYANGTWSRARVISWHR